MKEKLYLKILWVCKKINGCSDDDISDIRTETENNKSYNSLTDDEIIDLHTTVESEQEDDTNENTINNGDQPKLISYNEATSHLAQLMVNFKCQEKEPNELLMLKWMHDPAACKKHINWHSKRL